MVTALLCAAAALALSSRQLASDDLYKIFSNSTCSALTGYQPITDYLECRDAAAALQIVVTTDKTGLPQGLSLTDGTVPAHFLACRLDPSPAPIVHRNLAVLCECVSICFVPASPNVWATIVDDQTSLLPFHCCPEIEIA